MKTAEKTVPNGLFAAGKKVCSAKLQAQTFQTQQMIRQTRHTSLIVLCSHKFSLIISDWIFGLHTNCTVYSHYRGIHAHGEKGRKERVKQAESIIAMAFISLTHTNILLRFFSSPSCNQLHNALHNDSHIVSL